MEKAKFTSKEAAAAVMAKTGRTWTTVSTNGGVHVRALMPWGWDFVTAIDVHHFGSVAA